MKLKLLLGIGLCVLLCNQVGAQSQSLDKELSGLAEKLAAQIKESGKKKVTILDFADLQGNTTELGRFLAEQISVSLVERRSGFSVMDRANLKTILAEHKLTIEGLVDPENAKKLGQFSGVDAIVLGSYTPLSDEVAITTKIITTDTAEIVGAAKVRIPKAKEIDHLLASAINPSGPSNKLTATNKPQLDLAKLLQIEKNSQQIGDLFMKVESMRLTGDQYTGDILATVIFVNTNTTTPISVAINNRGSNVGGATSIVNSRGDEFQLSGMTGMSSAGIVSGSIWGDLTEIPPGKSVRSTIKYYIRWNEKAGDYRPYRLQAEVFVGNEENGKIINLKKHNVLIDVDAAK